MAETNRYLVYRGLDQESEPANNNPAVRQTDPEALPDYPDHPPATLPDYPYQTMLPDHPQTALPDYTDHPSPSAPPAEFVTASAAKIAAEEARAAADAREAAEAAAARPGETEFEAPPSYDAAMRGDF